LTGQPSPVSAGISQPSPVSAGISQPSPESAGISQPSPESAGISQPSPVSAFAGIGGRRNQTDPRVTFAAHGVTVPAGAVLALGASDASGPSRMRNRPLHLSHPPT
jgi:hypothetical protein